MKNKKFLFTIIFMAISFLSVSQAVVKKVPIPIDFSGKIYVTPDVEAQFPGGDDAWQAYLKENLKSSTPIKNGAPDGIYQIIVRFIVSTDGIISDVQPVTKFGYGLEDEAIKVIKMGPKWIPAIQKGKRVNSFKKQELTFIIKTK